MAILYRTRRKGTLLTLLQASSDLADRRSCLYNATMMMDEVRDKKRSIEYHDHGLVILCDEVDGDQNNNKVCNKNLIQFVT